VIVRGGWHYDDGDGGRRNPRQAFDRVAIVFAAIWAGAALVMLVLKLLLA
jgi:hypothetical protein